MRKVGASSSSSPAGFPPVDGSAMVPTSSSSSRGITAVWCSAGPDWNKTAGSGACRAAGDGGVGAGLGPAVAGSENHT